MTKQRQPEYWGTCTCGHIFTEPGYALSAHEINCWGKGGKTPHPRNPAFGNPRIGDATRGVPRKRLGLDSAPETEVACG